MLLRIKNLLVNSQNTALHDELKQDTSVVELGGWLRTLEQEHG